MRKAIYTGSQVANKIRTPTSLQTGKHITQFVNYSIIQLVKDLTDIVANINMKSSRIVHYHTLSTDTGFMIYIYMIYTHI